MVQMDGIMLYHRLVIKFCPSDVCVNNLSNNKSTLEATQTHYLIQGQITTTVPNMVIVYVALHKIKLIKIKIIITFLRSLSTYFVCCDGNSNL